MNDDNLRLIRDILTPVLGRTSWNARGAHCGAAHHQFRGQDDGRGRQVWPDALYGCDKKVAGPLTLLNMRLAHRGESRLRARGRRDIVEPHHRARAASRAPSANWSLIARSAVGRGSCSSSQAAARAPSASVSVAHS